MKLNFSQDILLNLNINLLQKQFHAQSISVWLLKWLHLYGKYNLGDVFLKSTMTSICEAKNAYDYPPFFCDKANF